MSTSKLEFRVAGLDCENEAAAIKRGLSRANGVTGVDVLPKSARVKIVYDPDRTDPKALKTLLGSLGFPATEGLEITEQTAPWKNPKVLTSLASGILLLIGWLVALVGAPPLLSKSLFVASILVGGYYFGREAVEGLVFERTISIEVLMSVAAIAAAAMGEVFEGAALVFLYSMSEAAEGYTEEKTRSAIKALMKLAPKTALIRRGSVEEEVPVEEVRVGDIFIVRPGEAVPTDGIVVGGASSVDQAPITGESVPVEKGESDLVFAASINGTGSLEVRATKIFADNTLSRIIHMVEEAQEKKGKGQRFIERFGRRYSPAVLAIGLLIAFVPPLALGAAWHIWIPRAIVFIVAAAPCALVISIPITMVASLGTAARRGVLIKGGTYVEELAKVKVVAFDKTGTVTKGEPEVTDTIVYPTSERGAPKSEADLLALAAAIERRSEHPLANAIVEHAAKTGVPSLSIEGFRSLPGEGAHAKVDGELAYIGNPDMFESRLGVPLDFAREDVTRLQGEGKTVVVLGGEKDVYGLVALRDNLRPNAKRAIDALHEAGVEKVVMLTGDNERTARAIALELGIDEVHSDMKPEDKLSMVKSLNERYGSIAMVGDGVNDAPALAEASVGVAMGAAGTDVALETADVALMGDDLDKLAYAINLAKRNASVVRQNLALSAVVIGVLIVGAVTGLFTLPVAVLGHEISEFIVIGSGLRMLRS